MRFIRLLPTITLLAITHASIVAKADPLSDTFKAGTAGFVLSHAKNKANEVINRAEQAGNAVVNNAAQRALEIIDAWAATNSDLLYQAFDQVSKERMTWFNEVDTTLSRLEHNEKILLKDLNDLSLKWSEIIKDLPLADKTPAVYSHSPKVLLPIGENIIALSIYGPRIGRAVKSLSLKGTAVPFDILSDSQIFAKLDRKSFEFDDSKSTYGSIEIKYDKTMFSILSPKTWFGSEIESRKLTLWQLPKSMATIKLKSTIQVEDWDRKDLPFHVHASGRDQPVHTPVSIPDAERENGWIVDRQRLAGLSAASTLFTPAGGCVGLVSTSMEDHRYLFHTQHGHRTQSNGHKRGVDVHCDVILPVRKEKVVVTEEVSPEHRIEWTSDKVINFPPNQKTYSSVIKMFDGREYIITPTANAPYGVMDITKTDSGLHVRPIPPNDF